MTGDAGFTEVSGASPKPRLTELAGDAVAIPNATGLSVDYIAYDKARDRVWLPTGGTGGVDVYDVANRSFTRVGGFGTAERDVRGKKRAIGPSAVAVGDGFAFVGDRATSEICPVDAATLKAGKCLKLPTAPDGVAYVAATKEVWVTTPRDKSIAVLDASKPAALAPKTVVKTQGEPEGYAVDESRGVFYTNLEDKNATVVVDVNTKQPKSTWSPGCGADGPRGVAVDATRSFVFVACTDRVQVLDGAHDGKKLATLDAAGGGVDNIDYLADKKMLYVAAGKGGKLLVARVEDDGHPVLVAEGAVSGGARNAVATRTGAAYLVDVADGRLVSFAPPP